jgi:hypothetical protein
LYGEAVSATVVASVQRARENQRFFVARPRDDVLRERDLDEPFVSPASLRCLFTVAAAISFARRLLRPRRCADSLMCSY